MLDLLEHIGGTNATPEQELGGSKGTGSEDYTPCGVGQMHGAEMSTVVSSNNVETCGMTTNAVNSLNTSIKPEVEVVSAIRADEVCCHWSTTFTTGVHISSVRVGSVLLTWNIVRCNAGPFGTGESLADNVEARLHVKFSIHRRMISPWNS